MNLAGKRVTFPWYPGNQTGTFIQFINMTVDGNVCVVALVLLDDGTVATPEVPFIRFLE